MSLEVPERIAHTPVHILAEQDAQDAPCHPTHQLEMPYSGPSERRKIRGKRTIISENMNRIIYFELKGKLVDI